MLEGYRGKGCDSSQRNHKNGVDGRLPEQSRGEQTGELPPSVQIVNLNDSISDKAVDLLRHYRLSHGLLIADSLIAATAITMNVDFLSKNQRDYKFIAGLRLNRYPLTADATA